MDRTKSKNLFVRWYHEDKNNKKSLKKFRLIYLYFVALSDVMIIL